MCVHVGLYFVPIAFCWWCFNEFSVVLNEFGRWNCAMSSGMSVVHVSKTTVFLCNIKYELHVLRPGNNMNRVN